MIPAAGQGALGIEVREDATTLRALLGRPSTSPPSWPHAERAVSRELGGSCSMPLAAHAVWQATSWCMSAALGDAEDPRGRCCAPQAQRPAVTRRSQARRAGRGRPWRSCAPPGAAAYLPAA
jgi:hydroxymethylbilane synthase